jgi:hypothetical protein
MEGKQLELLGLEDDDLLKLDKVIESLPKDRREVFIQKQIELADEKIIKSRMDNLIRIGAWVERKEYAAEIPAIVGPVFSAYQEMMESSPSGQIREQLSQFYNDWISKAIEKIESYMREREKGNG